MVGWERVDLFIRQTKADGSNKWKPFLALLLDWHVRFGCSEVILSVGYLKEQIIDYFGNEYKGTSPLCHRR